MDTEWREERGVYRADRDGVGGGLGGRGGDRGGRSRTPP